MFLEVLRSKYSSKYFIVIFEISELTTRYEFPQGAFSTDRILDVFASRFYFLYVILHLYKYCYTRVSIYCYIDRSLRVSSRGVQ
jgi:hypothetical protein